MKTRHVILNLPEQDEIFEKIISDEAHNIQNVNFSSAVVNGEVKHYVLLVWHDFEYGEHAF